MHMEWLIVNLFTCAYINARLTSYFHQYSVNSFIITIPNNKQSGSKVSVHNRKKNTGSISIYNNTYRLKGKCFRKNNSQYTF